MKFSATRKLITRTIVLWFLFPAAIFSQTYSFRNYGAESEIPSGFVYTVNQSDDGFLWIGTGSGITRFDGFSFFPVAFPDSVESRIPARSLRADNGVIWFGCNDGSVFYSEGNKLIPVKINNSKSISDILQGPDGLIYVIPQGNSIFTIDPLATEEIREYAIASDPVMFSASFTGSGKLLIGTQENILVCSLKSDSVQVENTIEGFEYSSVTAIHPLNDGTEFILGTDGGGIYHLSTNGNDHKLGRFKDKPEWEYLSIQSITKDANNSLWISTFGEGVFQVNFNGIPEISSVRNYSILNGLTSNDVNLVFQDVEGNYWMAFSGEGISMLDSFAYSYYKPGSGNNDNDIIFAGNFRGKYLLGTPAGFHLFDADEGKLLGYTDLSKQTGKSVITSYFIDEENNIWIGTEENGLFVRNTSGAIRSFFRSGDSGSDFIKDIIVNGQNIWIATKNGAIVIDRKSGSEKNRFDINKGLAHNSINKIMLGNDGLIYIGTESARLYSVDDQFNIKQGNAVMQGNTLNKILSFAQDKNGAVWVATQGNGIFKCIKDSIASLTRADNLMSNYCYSLLSDSENNIWIGHDKGFSILNQETGVIKIAGLGQGKTGKCNPGAMYESPDQKVFIGTTDGFIVYDRLKDKKENLAPKTNINFITVNDKVYPYQPSISLPYSKSNVIRINYSGISFDSPDQVFFSTYLENFDQGWNKMTSSREVSYNLSDGKYKFNLVSASEGLPHNDPVSFEIIIKPPFWRTWWFILSSVLLLAGIVFIIVREREKSQKKIQEYLEKELELRTSVVVKQKGEIELQNIAITDSINYAKRIQTSILPDIAKLKDSFKDAFILFHPRDIVSGDFYWFDRVSDEKFVLVCADSTGHGVPGAFMSMIGSTLLQDIVTRKKISKPSEILHLLDKQIFSTLNQNVELGVSNDGMDMVVCEFNIKNRHVRFASAMRPVIIVLEGEPYYIKGNRSSVGGESVIEKYYDDQEYYMSEGDTVYLFSDGLPDQFGGEEGKKMKIARLKKIIEDVSKLPMEDQKETISKFFFEWKGTYDQVDDVLLMGVRV